MKLGEVRVAEDSDFQKLKSLVKEKDWKLEYSKNNIHVYTKVNDVSEFKMIKTIASFEDVSAATVFDVLHDPFYRKTWDKNMLEGYEVSYLDSNNDIGYYRVKAPKPIKDRDFVMQRSWLELIREYYIMNHSIYHSGIPQKKNVVRAMTYLTGYYIVPSSLTRKEDLGCQLSYVAQLDPKGKLPSWGVNKITKMLAPKVIKQLHKSCKDYPEWKNKNNPNFKPWLAEQFEEFLPRLNMDDIKDINTETSELIDESQLTEDHTEEPDSIAES